MDGGQSQFSTPGGGSGSSGGSGSGDRDHDEKLKMQTLIDAQARVISTQAQLIRQLRDLLRATEDNT